jgi:predicted RNA-binding protein with EMAP domain
MNNSVSSDQSSVEEDPTPTQRIWAPVAELDQEHVRLFGELRAVMDRGDIDGATAIRIRIGEIEVQQRQNHIAARAYFLSKARR